MPPGGRGAGPGGPARWPGQAGPGWAGWAGWAGEAEDPLRVAVQEQARRLVVELEAREAGAGSRRPARRMIGPEEHLAPAMTAEVVDELAGVAAGLVGGGVDVDVRVLGGQRDHLGGPRVADVATHDDQFGELKCDGVQVRDRPAGLGGAERPGVADLEAEGDSQLDAFGVQRVVAAVAGWQVPQPRHHAQRTEAKVTDAAPQLPHGIHRMGEIHRGDTREPARVAAGDRGDGVIGNERAPRPPPRAQHPGLHARRVHRRHGRLDRNLAPGQLPVAPAPQRIKHRVLQELRRRVLHPGVDDHRFRPPVLARAHTTAQRTMAGTSSGRYLRGGTSA